jgi:uncharacterized membrane protein YqaE (UPF0057 family)
MLEEALDTVIVVCCIQFGLLGTLVLRGLGLQELLVQVLLACFFWLYRRVLFKFKLIKE